MNMPEELERRIMMPIQIYPLFETALRARSGRSIDEHQRHISELWSRFAEVATDNPYAWDRKGHTAEEIRTVTEKNRMVGFPYPKMMNSNNDVDMSAALIVCSAARAESLGVPRDKWVFPQSGSDAHEHAFVSHREHFWKTPAIELAGRRVLELAGVGIDDIGIIDLYSCFPSAVQLGAQSLGLDINRQLTRTGGLQFGGGPWNNADRVPDRAMRSLIAAFNGGFRFEHDPGGYVTEGITVREMKKGYATIGIDANGVLHVGVWGDDMHKNDGWVSLRQNLPPLVRGGMSVYKDYKWTDWGTDFGDKMYTYRSGICTRTDGSVMYLSAGDVNIDMFASVMVQFGCATGMELDINGNWPHFSTYSNFGGLTRYEIGRAHV